MMRITTSSGASFSGCAFSMDILTWCRCCHRYIYIVCATGKTALEMLRILESRKDNSPEDELAVAAAEQSRITKLRLVKLVQE